MLDPRTEIVVGRGGASGMSGRQQSEAPNRCRLDGRRRIAVGQAQSAISPGDQFVSAATDQRVQDMTLRHQGSRVGITLGVDDIPRALQSELGFGCAASKDGQVGQDRISQRRLAQVLHRGDFRGRRHAVAGGDERVDRARQPFITQEWIGGQPRGIAEQRCRLRPGAFGSPVVRQPCDVICESGIRRGRGGHQMPETLDGVGDDVGGPPVCIGDCLHTHQVDHRGVGRRIAQARFERRRCDE